MSSFLYSYSFCKDSDVCLQDEWNYINQWCKTKWVPGWMLDIDADCNAQSVIGACLPFVSTPGVTTQTRSANLPQGGQCTISIDATQYVGRLSFPKDDDLGVLYNAYEGG